MRLDPLPTQSDSAIEGLLDAAFGADRRGRTAYAIRRGMAWLTGLSFAAVDEETDAMIGLLQSWPVALHGDDGEQTSLVMVGPVAVLPDLQGDGIGRALMDHLVAAVDAVPTAPLVMIGDSGYYGRFWGFSAEATGQWRAPGPVDRARLLVRSASNLALPIGGALGPRLVIPAHA